MHFAAPLWLFALLPWFAVVLYLLWGRRRRVDVPFLDLWPAQDDDAVRVRRRSTPPPVALALAILATLLGILAAARPSVALPGAGQTVCIVLDRGYTMSAAGPGRVTRLVGAVDEVDDTLTRVALFRAMERWVVPGPNQQRTDASDLLYAPVQTPTAVDTRDAMRVAVRQALQDAAAAMAIVVTDQPVGIADERIVQVSPEGVVRNARIALTSARESPAPQVMVRLRAGAGFGRAKLRVTSDDQFVEREVMLPTTGDRNEFIDLPRFGQTIKAELLIDDDHLADNTAWLVREASWPRVEARGSSLPPHLQRMLEVYARQRPPSEASRTLVVVGSVEQLPSQEPGVVVPPVTSEAAAAPSATVKLETADHPITRGVTWSDVGAPGVSRDGPPAGWTPVVSSGGKVWVAVRDEPARAVWVGFDTGTWARSSEFVVFWANVFNWAGAGGERFASYPVGTPLDGTWSAVELAGSVAPPEHTLWPGLYRRSDGTSRALHAPDVPIPTATPTNWRERLNRLRDDPAGRFDLGPLLACLAILCLCGAALSWKRRPNAARTAQT